MSFLIFEQISLKYLLFQKEMLYIMITEINPYTKYQTYLLDFKSTWFFLQICGK